MAYDPVSIISVYNRRARLEDLQEKKRSLDVEIPRAFIARHLQPDDIALDAGGGTGINAIMMARHCRQVTLLDISPRILEQARRNVEAAGLADTVALVRGDISDLGCFPDESFTFVTCVGGALSQVLERHAQAIAELVRVAKRGAILVIGCASRLGYTRLRVAEGRLGEALQVHQTGEGSGDMGLPTRFFTVDEMRGLLEAAGCQVLETASAPALGATLHPGLYEEGEPWRALRALELELCTRPELLGAGPQLLFVARKKTPQRSRSKQRG